MAPWAWSDVLLAWACLGLAFGADGGTPFGGLIADSAGNLYGTTSAGNSLSGQGVVFKLSGTGFVTISASSIANE